MPNRAGIVSVWSSVSSQLPSRLTTAITLIPTGSIQIDHNFNLPLSRLKVVVFEDGTELEEATMNSNYSIAQIDNYSISVTNISGVSRTFDLLIVAFLLKIRANEFDSSALSGRTWIARSSSFNTTSGDSNVVNTTSGSITATLSATPSVGNVIEFFDDGDNFEVNNLILNGNGQKIGGSTDPFACNIKEKKWTATFINTSFGWAITY